MLHPTFPLDKHQDSSLLDWMQSRLFSLQRVVVAQWGFPPASFSLTLVLADFNKYLRILLWRYQLHATWKRAGGWVWEGVRVHGIVDRCPLPIGRFELTKHRLFSCNGSIGKGRRLAQWNQNFQLRLIAKYPRRHSGDAGGVGWRFAAHRWGPWGACTLAVFVFPPLGDCPDNPQEPLYGPWTFTVFLFTTF